MCQLKTRASDHSRIPYPHQKLYMHQLLLKHQANPNHSHTLSASTLSNALHTLMTLCRISSSVNFASLLYNRKLNESKLSFIGKICTNNPYNVKTVAPLHLQSLLGKTPEQSGIVFFYVVNFHTIHSTLRKPLMVLKAF